MTLRRRIIIHNRRYTRDFSRGEPVERKDNPTHVGVVQQINHRADGTTIVKVKWDNGWVEVLPQSSLRPHQTQRSAPTEVELMQGRLR